MLALPAALPCQVSSVSVSVLPFFWTGKSTMVVVPPQAAARVPVSKSSTENVPPNGISMWVCTSMPPGMTYRRGAAWTRSGEPARESVWAGSSRAAIVSPSTRTSAGNVPVAVTTVPPRMRVFTGPPLRLDQGAVGVRPPVPVELPLVPHLFEQVEVQVADEHLVGVVGGGAADDLAARVGEVGLAVEVVVTQRLDADPVDRADEVLVGHGGRGLLQLPQVLGQAAAGGRRVEHDLGPAQAQRPPAFGEVPLVADVDADLADRGVEHRVAEVARAEVVLLPEPVDLRDVILAMLAEVAAVGVDDRGGVVVHTLLLDLVHRDDQDHVQLAGQVLHQAGGGAAGNGLGPAVPLRVLHLAEVGAVEQLLQAGHLDPLAGCLPQGVNGVFDHGFFVAGPLLLDQRGANGGHSSSSRCQLGSSARMAAEGDRPSRVAPASTMASASAAERIPPDAFTPSRRPTVLAISSTAAMVAPPAGWNPVDVFTKSAPALSAAWHAATMDSSSSTAGSMITLSTTGLGISPRTVAISCSTSFHRPSLARPRLMTMSTSCAPVAAAMPASWALSPALWAPDGNPATAATLISWPGSSRAAVLTSVGDTHTAYTPSWRASAHRAAMSFSVASGASRVWSIISASWRRVRDSVTGAAPPILPDAGPPAAGPPEPGSGPPWTGRHRPRRATPPARRSSPWARCRWAG